MKILRDETKENLNRPDWFNHVWSIEGIHSYDAVRLREFIREATEAKKILDVGAGWRGFAEYACLNGYPGQYTAIDFSEVARERTLQSLGNRASRLDYQIGDALALPFGDGAFDIVGCGELIEHFYEPQKLVDELARVTKPGGRLVVSTLDANCDAAQARTYPEHLVQWDAPEELLPMFEPFGPSRAWTLGHYYLVECLVKRNRRAA